MTSWLRDVRDGVEARLAGFFREERERLVRLAPEAAELTDAIDVFTMRGGKRLRPALAFAAYKSVRLQGALSEIVDACAALELLQSYLLIHDDWMDGDDERRGGPAVHAALREGRADAHQANALAILAGDLASAQSWRLLSTASADPAIQARVIELALRMHEEVIIGQALDLTGAPDVSRMHQLKTGSYTVRGPLALGATLGGASREQHEALVRFGGPIGEAFQMRDDLLGTFGDPRVLGKSVGGDLRAAKRTALIRAAEERASPAELASIRAVLGRADASDAALAELRQTLVACGARAAVEARAGELLSAAKATLDDAPLSPLGAGMLRALADRLAVRDR